MPETLWRVYEKTRNGSCIRVRSLWTLREIKKANDFYGYQRFQPIEPVR